MKTPFLRTAYNYNTNEAGDESGLHCKDKTLTQQHFREECDINTIVERFHLTGEIPTNVHMPTYGDFSGVFDFQTAMQAIRTAQESFAAMPAPVRARFHNDPAEFVAFCDDKDNREEAVKLGLVLPAAKPEGTPPGPAPTAPAAAAAPLKTGP